ncbi:MAG: transposase [Methanothrix sp.]|nr:transposase [Methanothrix sp.]
MNDIKYIGIDVHQATSVLAVRNSQGKLIAEGIVETQPTPIIDFLKGQRGTVWVTFEEGTYANWLYDVLQPQVAKVVVCDPRKNKLDGNKSDKIDAKRLSELLRLNALTAVYHGQHSTQTLKELARSYLSLQQDSTRVMNRLKAIYRSRGIDCGGTSVYRPKHRKEWLEKLDGLGPRHRAEYLLTQLDVLRELGLGAQKELVRESRKHKSCKILRKVPGLGPIRTALILAFVVTPHRFRNKRQFWAYTGFSVVRKASAEYEISQGELRRTKKKPLPRGLNNNYNHVLKNVFKGAALTAAYRGAFKELFKQRVAKGTAPNLVLLTLARKIASITLALWKKGESFDIKRHRLSEQTT